MNDMRDPALERSLAAVWERHLPDTRQRLARVVEALDAIAEEAVDRARQERAIEDAHQLVGVSATFGHSDLSMLAETAERVLRSAPPATAADRAAAADLARQLRDAQPA